MIKMTKILTGITEINEMIEVAEAIKLTEMTARNVFTEIND